MLAELILALHLAVIGFNLFGLLAIPLGAWRGWDFVHRPAWRLLHLASLAAVALQALLGRACFLTVWQFAFQDANGRPEPLVMSWMNALIYWPLPPWTFTAIYLAILAYALALLWLVPLRPKGRER